ncbi:glutaredoxin domain-containing protein [Amycolatopsis sp. PS_44_ISF1]|uniref:glutaredoxin domain-containing protein n=1 Tax=Amycolatopsis sp. PS_44_ISF1 TaxID=2974917 RepID=UPI0028DE2CF9|nr:glutaredoxin domain-containing protein [Amycolatopsis sp. PS_44_ISF1]MDT8910847.1 NrdH-redoxin [Amycolatopsis sp. PS_44_ISF1]
MTEIEVEFYWRPGCGFCASLRRPLLASGLNVKEINIWEDPGAAERVRAVANGNETVPTVIIGSTALVNPSFDEVEAAVKAESAA